VYGEEGRPVPELPEVETFVRGLAPAVGQRITAAEVIDTKLAVSGEDLVGARIAGIRRRGKYIGVELEDGRTLVVHLRMSGRLRLRCRDCEAKYARMILRLGKNLSVYFVDPRRLGTANLCESGFDVPVGIEPLGPEFTAAALAKLAAASRAPVKQLLLDQRKVGGIGNIYAAESLWRAKIDPRRKASELSRAEIGRLHRAIVGVLDEAVTQLGTTLGSSVSDYQPTATETGSFQNHLAVYGREGEACERCGQGIERVVQAGRSTCFCPACQR
jgi:formamidopyrimidine-DNA glycosylase